MVLGAGAAFPRLAEAWIGRDVTWRAAAYGWPALVVFVLAALLAAAATLLARAWQWRRTAGANPAPTSLPPSRPAPPSRDRLHRRRSRPSDRGEQPRSRPRSTAVTHPPEKETTMSIQTHPTSRRAPHA